MERDLTRIGEKARREPKLVFTSLYHWITDKEQLRASYEELDKDAAPGIDGVTKEMYGEDLEENLKDLSARLGRMGYRPKPVKRVYIPKAGSDKKRPLGIPSLEDKIVQNAVKRVLEEIYETKFLGSSYGYRPGRSQHQALDDLGRTVQQRRINYVVEADIHGFFDHLNHEWLVKLLEVRIGDKRVIRLIWRMLKGGVMEDGLVRASEEGAPQGGILSPLLSNIYLHYVLDLWFEQRFRKGCFGEAQYFRFADDFLACFQNRREAERFLEEVKGRLEKFHLEVAEAKTKLMAFGRYARENAKRVGKEPETFVFLGFEHYWGKARNGWDVVRRRTSKVKFRAKLKEMKEWLRQERSHKKRGELLRKAKQKLEGHLNYYAIRGNAQMCDSFRRQVTKLLYKWLNRQSQRRSYTWGQFASALNWVGWPSVKIVHKLDPFRKLSA